MKQKIKEILIGLIVVWIVFIIINVFATPGPNSILIIAGGLIIGFSIIFLIVLSFLDRFTETVKPVYAPETGETSKLKHQLQSRPEDISLHQALARKYLKMGSDIFQSVLQDHRVGLGFYRKAETELLRILELDPNDAEALMNLAGTHCYLKRIKMAEQEFLRAIEVSPQNVEYKIVYARFLNNIKEDYYKAEAVLKQALTQPHTFELSCLIHYTLHDVYNRLGNYGKKSKRPAYKQHAESVLMDIFPEYESGKHLVKFVRDKNSAGWAEGIIFGKIGLLLIKQGPISRKGRTYDKVIELTRAC